MVSSFCQAKRGPEYHKEEVKKNLESQISKFGTFTSGRKLLELDTYVAFRASEITMSGLSSGYLVTTVTACNGAGTIIASNSAFVQGSGGRIQIFSKPNQSIA